MGSSPSLECLPESIIGLRMFGRMMNKRAGYIHFWLTIVGVYGTFFPMHFVGLSEHLVVIMLTQLTKDLMQH